MSEFIFPHILKLDKMVYKEKDPQNPGEEQPKMPGRGKPHPLIPPEEVPPPQTPPAREPPPFFYWEGVSHTN